MTLHLPNDFHFCKRRGLCRNSTANTTLICRVLWDTAQAHWGQRETRQVPWDWPSQYLDCSSRSECTILDTFHTGHSRSWVQGKTNFQCLHAVRNRVLTARSCSRLWICWSRHRASRFHTLSRSRRHPGPLSVHPVCSFARLPWNPQYSWPGCDYELSWPWHDWRVRWIAITLHPQSQPLRCYQFELKFTLDAISLADPRNFFQLQQPRHTCFPFYFL